MTGDAAHGDDGFVHTAPLDVESLLHDGAPDWGRIGFEVCCARCGYNLRGLAQPRCPECGLEFEWELALRQAESESDFLFEHQWRKRPIRSFVVTVWRSLLPGRFWRRVSIHDRLSVKPLLILLFTAPLVQLTLLWLVARLGARIWSLRTGRSSVYPWSGSFFDEYHEGEIEIRIAAPTTYEIWKSAIDSARSVLTTGSSMGFVFATVVGLGLMLAVLLLMLETRWQFKVRPVQVLRVIAHAAAPIVVWSVMVLALILEYFDLRWSGRFVGRDGRQLLAIVVSLGVWIIGFVCLRAGFRDYLRLRSGAMIAVVVSFVAAFGEFVVFMRQIWL